MNEQRLRQHLDRVGLRYRRLLTRWWLAVAWLTLAITGVALLARGRGYGNGIPGTASFLLLAIPVALLPALLAALRRVRDPLWLARRLERRFPDLDARLLAALEQRADGAGRPLGFLQQAVVDEAVEHARRSPWEQLVPNRRLRLAGAAQWAMAFAFAVVLGVSVIDASRPPGQPALWPTAAATESLWRIKVEPEDADIERGTSLLVLARFDRKLPSDAHLLVRDAGGAEQQLPMSKSLADPVFAGRLSGVARDLSYAVRYGDGQTRWYKVGVFDYPELKQADANLKFPRYTNLEEKRIEDVRSVTAVEGTRATLTFRLNKPVTQARLFPSAQRPADDSTAPATRPAPVELMADPNDPSVYTAALDLKQSQHYRLQLVDADNRESKTPAELAIHVVPNRPPDLKPGWPGRDVDVSPLQEVTVKAGVWDDFGVRRVGVSYAMAGRPSEEVVLGEGLAAKERREVGHLVSMERMAAKPDELLSYYFWVEDVGPDGAIRRTSGDMFFAEVRPFDEIFRQGEPPAGGEQQQQQGQGQNAKQAEELAEAQKQIIAATWKVIRRETSATPSAAFAPDVKLIAESQAEARETAAALEEKLTDERSRGYLRDVLARMETAVAELAKASGGATAGPLPAALAAEQAAYQGLLKLQAREHEVVRASQQQQGRGEQSASSAGNRKQQQLNQLELNKEDNRYETQRQAAPQPPEQAEHREARQVLNRLRELARRQEDLNRQMKEQQSALEQAREEAKREEARRQLARLSDQQQQMLRDTDELRDRMDQPENQEKMAEAREQLEQTRSNVRQASEALEKEKLPEATAAGARAGEQLNDLKERVRKQAAGQFDEAMNRIRRDARELDDKQKRVTEQLAEDGEGQPTAGQAQPGAQPSQPRPQRQTLRGADGGAGREQVAQDLQKQREQLERLLEEMKSTVEASEASEPLLSKQLYDAVRKARQGQADKALDASKQLLDRGFVEEARQAEGEAAKGITKLREGVEQAAKSVLGDEAEALRRARNELDDLAQQLEREMARGDGDGDGDAAGDEPTTRSAGGGEPLARAETGEPVSERRAGERPDGKPRPGETAQAGGQPRGGQPSGQSGEEPGAGGGAQQPGQGQRPGRGQAPNENGPGKGEGRDPSERAQATEAQGSGRPTPGEGRESSEGQGQGAPSPGDQRGQNPSGQPGGGGRRQAEGGLRRLAGGGEGGSSDGANERGGPITGEAFREWSDRLRDVEEMVADPKLRAEAARIRERAQAARAEFQKHSKDPNWPLVRQFVGRPLVELRDAVSRELMRRESPEALVPIEKEPVPPAYAELVKRYYERLGSGK